MDKVFVVWRGNGSVDLCTKEFMLRCMGGGRWSVRLTGTERPLYEDVTPDVALRCVECSNGWGKYVVSQTKSGDDGQFESLFGITFKPKEYVLQSMEVSGL